jgi:hypothetical protein
LQVERLWESNYWPGREGGEFQGGKGGAWDGAKLAGPRKSLPTRLSQGPGSGARVTRYWTAGAHQKAGSINYRKAPMMEKTEFNTGKSDVKELQRFLEGGFCIDFSAGAGLARPGAAGEMPCPNRARC